MKDRHPSEILFSNGLRECGAQSGTFYIRDPYWSHDLRLVYMPGVTYPEPMYGFLIPESSRTLVTAGEGEFVAMRGSHSLNGPFATVHPPPIARLFGDFAEREGVVTAARFTHRTGPIPEAVMFVNYATATSFAPELVSSLKRLMNDMVECIPSIKRFLLNAYAFPHQDLIHVLRPFAHLPSILQGSMTPSIESYFTQLLQASLTACGCGDSMGFGTVHLMGADKQNLQLKAWTGNVTEQELVNSHEISTAALRGVVGWVARKKKALWIDNVRESPFRDIRIPVRDDTQCELAVPMIAGDEVLGVFNLELARRPSDRSPYDLVRIIWYAANQSAIACRLSDEAMMALNQAELARKSAHLSGELLEICSSAPSRVKEQYPLNDVAILATRVLKASRCDIWRFDPAKDGFVGCGADYEKHYLDDPPRSKGGWTRYIHNSQQVVWLTGITSETGYSSLVWNPSTNDWGPSQCADLLPSNVNKRLVDQDVGSELGVPIHIGDSPVGVAWIKFREKDRPRPSSDEVRLAVGFAGQAALVILCVESQKRQDAVAQSEGVELILTLLRHDIPGTFLEKLVKELAHTASVDEFLVRKEEWIVLLSFLRTFIEQLRWYHPRENEKPHIECRLEKVLLERIVDRAVRIARLIDPIPDCSVEIPEDTYVMADEALLTLALYNIISNAKRYTPREAKSRCVELRSSCDDNHEVRVVIRDFGYGIKKEIAKLIGSKVGVRADPSDEPIHGMGFGAYLTRLIVEVHGGRILWQPAEPNGTAVQITLNSGRP